MSTFSNQASLSANGVILNSNIVTGELVQLLSVAKTSVDGVYRVNEPVTYVVTITNSGAVPFNDLTVTDNLGQYTFGANSPTPLTYIDDTVKLYSCGVLQKTPTVTPGTTLQIAGVSVPANSTVTLIYQARTNSYAPFVADASITNIVTVTGTGITTPLTTQNTIKPDSYTDLTILKQMQPESVVENQSVTYTFQIQNYGTCEAAAGDNVVLSDTFNPPLDNLSVCCGDTEWVDKTNYTYDKTQGLFTTVDGQIAVPAATFEQNADGVCCVTPGICEITVTGTM